MGDARSRLRMNGPKVVNLNPKNKGLGFPLNPLPILKRQLRKRQASSSMPIRKMMGCDTETIAGRVWLFSTEKGVWEISDFASFMDVLYSRPHLSKWKKTAKSGKGKKVRGYSPMEFFLWNLKFDAQAIFHLLEDDVVLTLIESREEGREGELGRNKIIVNADTGGFKPEVKGRMVELDYLEGKSLVIKPINWIWTTEHGTEYHLGNCYWWDISQFYGKMRLNDASKKYLGDNKVEEMFDGSILDAGRFDEVEYREKYLDDIKKYAIKDAVLTGKLARLKREDFVQTGIRFIRPYSLANVAQRNLLDMCNVPTINSYHGKKNDDRLELLHKANSAFLGGRFETSGSGYLPDVQSIDLSSAYPYWMYWLPNTSLGTWYRRHGKSSLLNWMEKREPHHMGFVEASFLFDTDSEWNPLCVKKESGTLVSPRLARGWFTANEIQEALQWPLKSFRIGEWFYLKDDAEQYPFRKFVHHYYKMKSKAPDGSVSRWASKTQLNSIFGKTRQSVNNKAGKLWNAFYAATITGNCRAQLAEILRMNDYSAVQLATDGVFFQTDDLVDVPNRPLPATGNLGQWELENRGEFLCLGSGIYSMRDSNYVKTRFRGTASYFLRGNNLFDFCEENEDYFSVSRTVRKPFSAKEARARGDMSKMNVFRPVKISMTVQGDSEKRLWERRPEMFKDIQSKWWPSRSYLKVQ
jgi:hypothetical protein